MHTVCSLVVEELFTAIGRSLDLCDLQSRGMHERNSPNTSNQSKRVVSNGRVARDSEMAGFKTRFRIICKYNRKPTPGKHQAPLPLYRKATYFKRLIFKVA